MQYFVKMSNEFEFTGEKGQISYFDLAIKAIHVHSIAKV